MKSQYPILVLLFSFALPIAAQNFYIDENGVTIKCENCSPGDTGTINGILYEAVDRELLDQRINDTADLTILCTSLVTEMDSLFYGMEEFNQDIGSWDVSNVTDMNGMFAGNINRCCPYHPTKFNQDIGSWDVSNVTDMGSMFKGSTFNQDIGSWDVSNVINMSDMFGGSDDWPPFSNMFNQDIGSWDVSNVTDMSGMFSGAGNFNQDIGGWDVSNVKDMSRMFCNFSGVISDFNQDISSWDVSSVTNMKGMFYWCAFNQDISSWVVSNVTNMGSMFQSSRFNQDIGYWDVSNVVDMLNMFYEADSFNQDLSLWCVEKIPSEPENFVGGVCPLQPEFFPVWGTCPAQDSIVSIPDKAFLYALIEEGVDTNGDSLISYTEAEAVISIDVSGEEEQQVFGLYCHGEIKSLEGIEAFINLDTLDCHCGLIENLDLSSNTALTYFDCRRNQLTSLDVSKNIALTDLRCSENLLTVLDISKNVALTDLRCSGNLLTILDISNNLTLNLLHCGGWWGNDITRLDVSKHTALTSLYCEYNQLAKLDVSKNTSLTSLNCAGNQLTSLDVSNNTALTFLDCGGNQLVNLDVSSNTALTFLMCGDISLSKLDVTNNISLIDLDCGSNQLTTLDLSHNTALTLLACYDNLLSSLDVSNNTSLTSLACGTNQLTNLDISNNTKLKKLSIEYMPSLGNVCHWAYFCPFLPDLIDVESWESPNVYYTSKYGGIYLFAPPLLYRPESIEVYSSTDGMIYLVPKNTSKNIIAIRDACLDSLAALPNAKVDFPLTSIENGEYWLYGRDTLGYISNEVAFRIQGSTVGFDNTSTDQFKIYPIPTYKLLTIETGDSGIKSVDITSLNGQRIFSQEMEGTTHQLDLSSFRKGIYFITIRSTDFVTTRKIIKL